jgi:ABC-type multidrug transport system fused ATPase/permease subunit
MKSKTFFLLIRYSHTAEGFIKIGGVQVDSVGLHDIRDKMAVIPQDSFVFSGSLKFNVDPFEEFSDEEVFSILERVRFMQTLLTENENQTEGKLLDKVIHFINNQCRMPTNRV